jgi:hypothetical protein
MLACAPRASPSLVVHCCCCAVCHGALSVSRNLESSIVSSTPNVKWADVAGLEGASPQHAICNGRRQVRSARESEDLAWWLRSALRSGSSRIPAPREPRPSSAFGMRWRCSGEKGAQRGCYLADSVPWALHGRTCTHSCIGAYCMPRMPHAACCTSPVGRGWTLCRRGGHGRACSCTGRPARARVIWRRPWPPRPRPFSTQ